LSASREAEAELDQLPETGLFQRSSCGALQKQAHWKALREQIASGDDLLTDIHICIVSIGHPAAVGR